MKAITESTERQDPQPQKQIDSAPPDSELLFQRYQFHGFPRHGSGPLPGNGHY